MKKYRIVYYALVADEYIEHWFYLFATNKQKAIKRFMKITECEKEDIISINEVGD